MNEAAGDMEGQPGYAPNPEQHEKQHQKNKVSYHELRSLVASRRKSAEHSGCHSASGTPATLYASYKPRHLNFFYGTPDRKSHESLSQRRARCRCCVAHDPSRAVRTPRAQWGGEVDTHADFGHTSRSRFRVRNSE